MQLETAMLAAVALVVCTAACSRVDQPEPSSSKPRSLDGLIAFSNPRTCDLTPTFEEFLGSFIDVDQSGQRLIKGRLKAPRFYAGQIGYLDVRDGPEGTTVATVPLTGTWQGLELTHVQIIQKAESDVWRLLIQFKAPPNEVIVAANRAGFGLPPNGLGQPPASEWGLEPMISVVAVEGGSALVCAV